MQCMVHVQGQQAVTGAESDRGRRQQGLPTALRRGPGLRLPSRARAATTTRAEELDRPAPAGSPGRHPQPGGRGGGLTFLVAGTPNRASSASDTEQVRAAELDSPEPAHAGRGHCPPPGTGVHHQAGLLQTLGEQALQASEQGAWCKPGSN